MASPISAPPQTTFSRPGGRPASARWCASRSVESGEAVKLPQRKRDAWWEGTNRQWPFMAAHLGISRDTLMAHYLSNHIAVAYGDVFDEMVALSGELGFRVRVLGAR